MIVDFRDAEEARNEGLTEVSSYGVIGAEEAMTDMGLMFTSLIIEGPRGGKKQQFKWYHRGDSGIVDDIFCSFMSHFLLKAYFYQATCFSGGKPIRIAKRLNASKPQITLAMASMSALDHWERFTS